MTTRNKIPTLSHDQAVAIINEAKANGAMSSEMPEHEADRMSAARKTIAMALSAWERGVKTNGVTSVLNLARVGNESIIPNPYGSDPVIPAEKKPDVAEEDAPVVVKPAEKAQETVPPPVVAPASPSLPPLPAGREMVVDRTQGLGLPIPDRVDPSQIDPMPRDLTGLSDRELRKAHGEWHGIFAWTQWNLSLEEADSLASGHLLDNERHRALISIPKIDPNTNKAKLTDVVKSEVEMSSEVVAMADRHQSHVNAVRALKALTAIFQGNVDRISREITARHNDWVRSQGGHS